MISCVHVKLRVPDHSYNRDLDRIEVGTTTLTTVAFSPEGKKYILRVFKRTMFNVIAIDEMQ